ncbi:MAG: hypothetical protein M3R38_11985 [Actinomycetota bacterium]|nr:hypothetical protein [Actinomycetota bacterium]
MNYRNFDDAQGALSNLVGVQSALRDFAGIQETLARIERDRWEAMQPIASRGVAGIAHVQRTNVAGLSLNAARVFSAEGVASRVAQTLADSASGVRSISELARPFLERPVVDFHGTIGNLLGESAFLNGAANDALRANAQWKPVLTRFAQEPVWDILSMQSVGLARAVSAAARPLALSAAADALASLRRLPVVNPNIFKMRPLLTPFVDLPELDLPLLPEEPQEGPADAEQSVGQDEGATIFAPGSEFVTRAEFEGLQQEVARLNRSFARMNRPLYVQWGEKLVISLLSGLILKIVWEHTAAGDVAEVVVDQIVVVIEGVVYVLPFIP